jgi:RNA polymerase sigma factor (TIGR02999 family)
MDADITGLLQAWKAGDRSVEEALIRSVYPNLRSLAQAQLGRMGPQHTFQATEVVHEAFERLQKQQHVDWQDRAHFMAICATVLRRVLIDHLRSRDRQKRGGGYETVAFDLGMEQALPATSSGLDWIELDEALKALEAVDAPAARVVELRAFGGLEVEEVAAAMSSSTATVGRQWRFARAWLAARLAEGA